LGIAPYRKISGSHEVGQGDNQQLRPPPRVIGLAGTPHHHDSPPRTGLHPSTRKVPSTGQSVLGKEAVFPPPFDPTHHSIYL